MAGSHASSQGTAPRPRPKFLTITNIARLCATFGALIPVSTASAIFPRAVNPPTALPENATPADLKWQPAMDYDTDGCYNVPAISKDGKVAEGLPHDYTTGSEDCRDQADLDNSNAYARQRCNSGWCVYLYDYYFEKDVAVVAVADAGGHVNDWEHIVVWVKDDKAEYVGASAHGGYDVKPANEVRWDGTHPKIVYHKDKGSTHAFRFASANDEPPENHYGRWIRSPLISYNGFPAGIRDVLVDHDFGSASIAFKDSSFGGNLENAMPKDHTTECTSDPDGGAVCWDVATPKFPFDYTRDDGSPGDPNPPVTPTPPPEQPQPPIIKVMVVGDSISHGHEGDWTWRYRLWEWFKRDDVAVDFVGPYTGTQPPNAPAAPAPPSVEGDDPPPPDLPRTWGKYAAGVSADFDSDHFAVWGRQAAQDKNLIKDQVTKFRPDYLLVELGFNDMGWFVSGPEGTLQSMKSLVDEARAAKPNIKFALANVPQRSLIGGRDDLPLNTNTYNDMLKKAIPAWSTSTSPVELVEFRENYQCETGGCPAGYDGLHPNALGEYQIAQAFSRTLNQRYKLGKSVLSVPGNIPDRPTPVPSNFKAESAPSGIKVTWDAVFGASGYDIRNRLVGNPTWSQWTISTNRYDTTWTLDGQAWEYQVRTSNGDQRKSAWTGIISAVAHPQTAPPPGNVVTRATGTGIDISWSAPGGTNAGSVDRYEVLTFDKDTPGVYLSSKGVKGLSLHVDELLPDHHYAIAVVAWNAAGGGFPGVGRAVTVGAGTPPVPTNLQVVSTDPTTVQLTWSGSRAAAGYRSWVRNINNSSSVSTADQTSVDTTSHGIAFLFPGVWNYEFCVTAFNGEAESGKSNCVVAPRPAGS